MAPKDKEGETVATFSGKWIAILHTGAAYAAFLGALIVGMWLHYHKIVKNEFYGYPEEWFPSVSATIGDRYPERSVFQFFIAITSGPRFALVVMWYILAAKPSSALPKFIVGAGIFRTVTCGGWTYITSTDDHDWHDIFMISYLVATLPWTIGCVAISPPNPRAIKYRKALAGAFFATLVPMIYYFIQHKVHRVPGAYTTYAFFEWSLVLLDVGFDAVTILDFESFEIVVKDIRGISRGNGDAVGSSRLKDQEGQSTLWKSIVAGEFSNAAAIDALADVYNAFVFWSVITSLGLVVWYFPLWFMGISGYEAFIMMTLSPFFLANRPIRSFVIRHLTHCHLGSLIGVASFWIKTPELRLLAVGIGVAMTCLAWTATFYADSSQPQRLEARMSAFTLGLLASCLAKYAFWTNNPIWPVMHHANGGWNNIGLILGILAVLRSTRRNVAIESYAPSNRISNGAQVPAAFGVAGVLFGMHSLLSDSSTMILWVWDGYPVRGPLAVPHGSLTMAAMGAGFLIGVYGRSFAQSWTFYGLGCIGAAILTTSHQWLGYYGALMLATYLMAVAPVLIASAVRHSPAKTFGIAFLTYNVMVLAHVWVVAYAFVPGGPIMREHTDWVMTAMMLLIGVGVFSAQTAPNTAVSPRITSKAPALNQQDQRSYYLYILIAFQVLSFAVSYRRFPSYHYTPHHPEEKLITAGIWTTHFSIDNDMWSSERRMRDLIRDVELDVVGFLESDTQRIIMGNRDVTQYIAEDLGMYVDYGPGPNKHTWGAALLSKFPILNSTHHLLPSPVGELAPAIHATIDAYGTLVDIFVFHSGQEEDEEDRRLQSIYLSELMRASPRPSILLSYLVIEPGEGNYNTYVGETSSMRDIDRFDMDRWCEYILYKGLRRSGYARVSRDSITDTELQVGKFIVGEKENVGDKRMPERKVPEALRFPDMFKGEGVRGHKYHVFGRPRYYK